MSPLRIFVIDDDASVRKGLQRLLRSAGMSVETFSSAEEFLDAKLPPPDCLVLDVRMPGTSGWELQQRLEVDDQRLPIVFITAHEDEPSRQSAMLAGAVDFLHKPFEDHVLLDAISRTVAWRAADAKLRRASKDVRSQLPAESEHSDAPKGDAR